MKIFRHTNLVFTSNTYIIADFLQKGVYLIDPGSDSYDIIKWLDDADYYIISTFLTHSHHDHIYGLNDILRKFPNSTLYVSKLSEEGLFSSKKNLSYYNDIPFIYDDVFLKNISFIEDECKLILWDNVELTVIGTPGHTLDSISFYVKNCFFSGDAFIPGKKVHYKKGIGKNDNFGPSVENSIKRIHHVMNVGSFLFPGHGIEYSKNDLELVNNFNKLEFTNGFFEVIEV